MAENNGLQLDDDALLSGFLTGLVIGGVSAFFAGPRIRLETLIPRRQQVTEAVEGATQTIRDRVNTDPLQESIEEGKEAARKRRTASA